MQRVFLALVCLSITTISSHAQVLVNYNFATDLNPSTTATNSTASAITATYTNPGSDWGRSPSFFNLFVRSPQTPATFDSTSYFQFTITPDSGYQFDLTQLSFNYGVQYGGSGPAYQSTFVVRSSVDSFASDIVSVPSSISLTTTSTNTNTPNSATFDLTGALFQNLTAATTFRIYIFDNSSATANISRLDNIQVDGSIALIPEPSSIALLLAGGIIVVALRRRRS
jgi:hypothetical protein